MEDLIELNPDVTLTLDELSHIIDYRGLGQVSGRVVPYPCLQYISHDRANRSEQPWRQLFYRLESSPLKGDYTRQLLFHWHLANLKVKDLDLSDPASDFRKATVTVRSLSEFFSSCDYAMPAGLVSNLANTSCVEPSPSRNTTDADLKRCQKALAVIVFGLLSAPKFQNAGKPNINQIVATALEAFNKDSGSAPHGYSQSLLRQAVSDALKACTDISEA